MKLNFAGYFTVFLFASCFSLNANAAFIIKEKRGNDGTTITQGNLYRPIENSENTINSSYGNILTNTEIKSDSQGESKDEIREKNRLATWAIIAISGLIFGGVGLIFCLLFHSLMVSVLPVICAIFFSFGWGYLAGARLGFYLGEKGQLKTKHMDIKSHTD